MNPTEINSIKVSVVISTYNRPDALKVCVRSVLNQTRLPDEIVIGDDGSDDNTLQVIKELQKESPIPVKHVWQEHNGFRVAMLRNKTVAATSGEYIIELDGDVFLHRKHIEDHLSMAQRGCYVKGGRVDLGPKLTGKICTAEQPRPISLFTPDIKKKRENAIRCMPLARYLAPRYRKNKYKSSALGCNISFFRDDFFRINGYDEFYEGWGGEDVDFGNRLIRSGVKKRYLKLGGIVYHLWHAPRARYNEDKNIAWRDRPDEENPVYCPDGADKYLK